MILDRLRAMFRRGRLHKALPSKAEIPKNQTSRAPHQALPRDPVRQNRDEIPKNQMSRAPHQVLPSGALPKAEVLWYYTPPVARQGGVKLAETGYAGQTASPTESGFLRVGMEEDVVVQRISRDLYASPESGIRELFVNEARACREAKNAGHNPEIHLWVDKASRSIVLEGIDSMGMSWSVFSNIFCVLGRSTNFDGKESGQFGFGRAAYLCISDTMILETYCRETGERYGVMGMSGMGFQTGLPVPKMDHFGTRVRMTANKDVDLKKITSMVRNCAALCEINTFIHVTKPGAASKDEVVRPLTVTSVTAAGMYTGGRSALGRGSTFGSTELHPGQEPGHDTLPLVQSPFGSTSLYSLDGKDIDIAFTVRLEKTGEPEFLHRTQKMFLCGVPVGYEYDGRYRRALKMLVVNIKD